MKQNDWIIANLNNPDFTVSDFKNIGGLSLENTQLLSMDNYLKNEKVTNNELFKDSSGVFNKDIFKGYYNKLAEKFNNFALESSLDNYEYGFWDVFKKNNSRVRNPLFTIDKVSNPTHQSTGVIGINIQGERTKSDLELAEKQKIYDWKEGKFKDESPEDNALFSNPFKFIKQIFSDPLVLAKYEEDTEEYDPFSGELVLHKKGENKINSEGEYYFETLGGRSIAGKQVLSLGDIITKEDLAVNAYDFFDSDDIKKSPEGVIARNLAAVAPMVFLGPVGSSIYSGFYVGRELLKTFPMLYNIGTMFSDGEVPSMLNTLAGFGQSLTGGTSDYGKSTTFSFENFGNLIGDVALQWGQLLFIANSIVKLKSSNLSMLDVAKAKAIGEYERQAANIINKAEQGSFNLALAKSFTGVNKVSDIKSMLLNDAWVNTLVGLKAIEKYIPEIEKVWSNRLKLGQDLSLVYMALISNTDVYDGAIAHGATKTEAAAVALGSTVGMFSVDKYLGLGEMFFDDELATAKRTYRQALKKSVEQDVKPVIERLGNIPKVERESKNSLMNLFNKGKDSVTKFLKDYKYNIKSRSLSILGKSIGEGLEEVSEEFVTDINRSLYELAGKFGWASLTDIGAWDNMSERYLMSLFGGAAGGALFGGINAIKNPKSVSDKNTQKELIHLVKEKRTSDILKELQKMRDRGECGNKELSINTNKSEEGNYFISADENNISQNDFIYNQMKTAILQMDKIINGNQLGLTEDLLFERLLLSDIKLMHLKDFLKDSSYMSGYFREYEKILLDIYNNEVRILELENSTTDATKRGTEEYKTQLENLLSERDKLFELKEEFFKNKTQRYLRKTLFGTNAAISGSLLPVTYNLYVLLKFGKEEKYLSENQKQEAKRLYNVYIKTKKLKDFDEAFEAWDKMCDLINPTLLGLDLGEIETWLKARDYFLKYIPDFLNPDYNERVKSLTYDLDLELKKLGVIKTPEYDKPWRSDPTKSNKTFDLLLQENPSMYFQIVKDNEDKYWSIHFKTDNEYREEGQPYSGLDDNLKLRLFLAASLVIPEGEFLSTHGELTPGGISGMNRFGQRDFTGRIRFIKTGVRKVKTKGAKEFSFVVSGTSKSGKTREGKYNAILDDDNFWHIKHEGNSITKRGMSKEEMSEKGITLEDIFGEKDSWGDPNLYDETINNFERFTVEDITIRPDGTISLHILDDGGDSFIIEGNSAQKIYNILFPDININNYQSQDIEIPIWQKVTGETDKEYENRNKAMDGESEELFNRRKNERIFRINQQAIDKEFETLLKLLDSDAVIDSNTYRYIVAKIRQRAKDIKNNILRKFGKEHILYGRIQEILENFNDDLSNIDEIWNQIESLLKDFYSSIYQKKLEEKGIGEAQIVPKDIEKTSDGYITFIAIYNYLKNKLGNSYWHDSSEFIAGMVNGSNDVNYFIDNLDVGIQIKHDLKDFFNILQYKNGSTEEYYDKDDNKVSGIILSGDYFINSENGEPLKIEGPVDNIDRLTEIALSIREKYIGLDFKDKNIAYDKSIVIDKIVNEQLNLNKQYFNSIIEEIQKNKQYSILLKLPEKIRKINRPTLKLLKSIADKIGIDFTDIETTLESILERFNGLAEVSDFRLSDSQIDALENAKNLIELAKSVIIAASGNDSYFTPWNYNKTINEWNKRHKSEIDGDIDELPEIDENTANVLLLDLHLYQIEINLWLSRAKENGINKQKMFREFDTKFEEVKLKFVMENRHKFILDDGTDLLEGFNLKENAKESVLEFERVFYNNVQQALKEGKTIEDLFKAVEGSINWKEAIKLKTSRLNLNLEELSDYDKFVYLITSMCYKPDNFYSDYKVFVEENGSIIAPLSFLKYAIRIIKALELNLDFINKMLSLFKDKTGFEGIVLDNTSILTGVGGAGKSSVVIKGSQTNHSYISGPTETQITNLLKYVKNPKEYSKEDLLKLILEDLYDLFVNDLLLSENRKLLKSYKLKHIGEIFKVDKIKVNKLENPPKQIIIDEATLLSNVELLVISKFCKENEIHLILAGDETQRGNLKQGWNMDRETSLAIRVPKLGMSLRENNLWKFQNQDTLWNFINTLIDTDSKDETSAVNSRLLDTDLKKYKLKYYFKDGKFYGDMIINSEITDDLMNAIQWSTNDKPNVCFIGSTSSETYRKLKSSGKNFDVKTLEGILGYEYDYVICDIDWKNMLKGAEKNVTATLGFLQTLNTLLTRSKDGTYFVNNGLSDIIEGNSALSYNAPTVNFDKKAIEEFSKYELDWINKHEWNPSEVKERTKKVSLKKDKVISIESEPDDPKIKPLKSENDENKVIDPLPKNSTSRSLPIHTYTNFNYLGINRRLDDEGKKGIWFNDNDSHRDIGIFLRKGTDVIEDVDKLFYVDKLLDLKSAILFLNFETARYVSNIFTIIPRKNLKDIEYYVVREKYDPQIHHLLTLEQDIKEPEKDKIIYTLLCRFKDSDGNICSVTLGVLPEPDKINRSICKSQFLREYDRLEDNEENKELRKWYHDILTDEGKFNQLFINYASNLEKIGSEEGSKPEKRIKKPDFLGMTGLRNIGFHMRLEEVNSLTSRYDVRNSSYIISPIYSSVISNEELLKLFGREFKTAGKPFILVSADRSLRPEDLIETYEEQLRNPNSQIRVRQIMLDSTGISFESLFDYRYKDSFTTVGSMDNAYTFPFDLLPTGLRMYVALHNFRANLIKLDDKIKKKYGDDISTLTKIAKEESRLYLLYIKNNPEGTSAGFKTWLKANKSEVQNDITFDLINDLWNFNDNDLRDVKQFRIGYDTQDDPSGVYVRNISENYNGNYINPSLVGLWLGTIQKIFDVALDKLVPSESLEGIGDITEISDYKKLKEIENTWVKKLEDKKEIRFNLESEDEDGVVITIPNTRGLRAIPLILTQIVKNLQATQRVPESKYSDYDTNEESHYAVVIKNPDGTVSDFIKYLEILKGGLGKIGNKSDIEPGVYPRGESFLDRRLINMFHVAFHGAVSLYSTKEDRENYLKYRNDFLKDRKAHAKDVLFPYGFFVDPILGGNHVDTSIFRIINTSRKYYATNMAPSGVKTYISFDPFEEETESKMNHNEDEGKNIDNELIELYNKLNESFGNDEWIVSEINNKEDLINDAKTYINNWLNIDFGTNSKINNIDLLLKIVFDITDKGELIYLDDEKLLKDVNNNNILSVIQKGETFEVNTKDNKKYIINKNGQVIESSVLFNNEGLKEISGKGFITYMLNEGEITLDDITNRIENDLEELGVITLSGNDDVDKQFINQFKLDIKDVLRDIYILNIDSQLDSYINQCNG